jgi:hypothetical protein
MSTPFNPAIVQQVTAVIDRATGLALQADSAAAAEELARLPAAVFDGEAAAFRQCMIERFGLQGNPEFNFEVQDRWVAELVQVYVRYWHQVLTKRQSLTDAETELQAAVGALMGHSFAGDDLLDTVEVEIQSELAMRGFHSLLGRTAPLLELILWRDQVVSQAEVQLPEGVHYVSVTYLNDWATQDGLFAVVPVYKQLDDEVFTVRFLAHEAQHYADKQAFGSLDDWELEYRAKLAELALATTIQRDALKRMCENRSDRTKQAPHAYANFAVIQDLERHLASHLSQFALCDGRVDDEQAIRDAAKALLIEDSRRRRVIVA